MSDKTAPKTGTDTSVDSLTPCYKPWSFFADECPWRRLDESLGLCCAGNIDDCGVYGPCYEDDCAPYHFVRKGL